MKKLFLFLLIGGFIVSCSNNESSSSEDAVVNEEQVQESEYMVFGDESITMDGAVAISEIPSMMEGQDSLELKVSGVINEACQTKGCWMTMDMGNGEEMMVRFKDYGFFVPKDAGGKDCVIEGVVKVEVITVAELQHYAEDAGKSEEEIAAITESETTMSFTASGVIIQ